MLELWKPLLLLKNKNNPVLFNEIGFKYDNPNKNLRPFIIFYDDSEKCYYYLKARDAIITNQNHPKYGQYKKKFKGELLIKPSLNGLLTKDSYVDCSQIFKMQRQELESLIDKDSFIFKQTTQLSDFYIKEIKDMIKFCVMQIPPYLSIIEVKINENNGTYAKSLYLCDEKLDNMYEIYDSYDELANEFNLDEFKSSPSDYSSTSNIRYQNGIDFCKLFLNEYFPNEIEKFDQIQKSNNNQSISAKDLDQAVNNNNAENDNCHKPDNQNIKL